MAIYQAIFSDIFNPKCLSIHLAASKQIEINMRTVDELHSDAINGLMLGGLKTIRLGKQAYDYKGVKIKQPTTYKPIFIAKSEYPEYDRIMTERCRIAKA